MAQALTVQGATGVAEAATQVAESRNEMGIGGSNLEGGSAHRPLRFAPVCGAFGRLFAVDERERGGGASLFPRLPR